MRRVIVAWAAAMAVVVLAPVAAAADDEFAKAMASYELGDDAAALKAFEKAAKAKGVSDADLIAIYTYAGVAAFRSGDKKLAEDHFKRAVALDPEVVAPYEAPEDAKELLERVRKKGGGGTSAPPSGGPAEFKVRRPDEVPAGKPIQVRIEKASSEIEEMVLRHRVPPGQWETLTAVPRGEGVFEVEISPPSVDPENGGDVQFYLEANTGTGDTVARFGSEGTPKVIRVTAGGLAVIGGTRTITATETHEGDGAILGGPGDEDRVGGESIFSQWWFWTGVGVVAAAGGVTAYFLLSGEESEAIPCPEAAAGTGCVDVTITGMTLRPGAFRW